MAKTVLITGTSTGIGKEAALLLAERGHRVIATGRSSKSLSDLRQAASERHLSIETDILDITKSADCSRIARKYHPDVLICNAGTGQTGPIVEVPLERIREDFETNVFGTVALIQAMSPSMIKHKKGRIIIVSSIVGLTVPMFFNPYAGSKAALESIAASMRNELKYFNIDVAIINPGRIGGGHNGEISATKYEWLKPESQYYKLIPEMKRHDAVLLDFSYPIAPVARDIARAVEDTHPRVRYASPFKYRLGLIVIRILPSRVMDWVFFKATRLRFLK